MILKAQPIKEKNDKFPSLKLRTHAFCKTLKRMNRQATDWEKYLKATYLKRNTQN